MSLFKEQEKTARVYFPVDSMVTKITKFTGFAFEIQINIIRMGFDGVMIADINMPEFRANVAGANAGRIKKGCLIEIVSTNEVFQVENTPRLSALFKSYKLDLKKYEGVPIILEQTPVELDEGGFLLFD
jgi:hypothetical protein